jgi:hypothetical protein
MAAWGQIDSRVALVDDYFSRNILNTHSLALHYLSLSRLFFAFGGRSIRSYGRSSLVLAHVVPGNTR